MAKKKKKKSAGGGSQPMSDKRYLAEKARTLPIYKCYITAGWEQEGLASVVVTRERPSGNLCMALFLCDCWCLGVKDVFGSVNISKEEFQEKILNRNPRYEECDYTYAHNLIYGAEAFAADADIQPHPDFAKWSQVLEEDTDDVPLIELEFGDLGKYHLVARPGSRESLYAPILKKRLGDDFISEITNYGSLPLDDTDPSHNHDDYYEDDSDEDPAFTPSMVYRMAERFKEAKAEDDRHPDEPYSYQHPEYPATLNLKHPFIAEEFRKPANSLTLPNDVIDRILALPKDEVVRDISNIVMNTIGHTWEGIDSNSVEWDDDGSLLHSLAFLTQIGYPEGLNAVLEVLRQNDEFTEFHFGDITSMIVPHALYATGKNHTDVMEEFLRHPGYTGFNKEYVSNALSFIAQQEPERRDEIIRIFSRYLDFMQKNIPDINGCSGNVAGAIMSTLIDLHAVELLPQIKRLYDSGYVNLNICGTYDQVKESMEEEWGPSEVFDFNDIKNFYKSLKMSFGNN